MDDQGDIMCPSCAEVIKAAAKRCRYCGHDLTPWWQFSSGRSQGSSSDGWAGGRTPIERERKGLGCFQAVLIAVGALILALYWVWPSDEEVDGKRESFLASAPRELVTPKEFADAYSKNKLAAEARFEGKAIEMRGKVKSVREGNSDSIIIVFDGGPGVEVSTSVEGDDRAKAAALSSGQLATVHCASVLDILGVQVLARCRLRD